MLAPFDRLLAISTAVLVEEGEELVVFLRA